jgi:hypothetical protein
MPVSELKILTEVFLPFHSFRLLKLGKITFFHIPSNSLSVIILPFIVTKLKLSQLPLSRPPINEMKYHYRNSTPNALIKMKADSNSNGMHICEFT